MSELHRLRAPVEWATTFDALSYTSLDAIERCPRQWQLQRSKWEGFDRLPTRPSAAALEGSIVHDVLDQTFRAMAFAGLPPITSAAFRETLARLDVMGLIQRRIDAANASLKAHPRYASLRLRHDARALYNRVAQLFHREYASVERVDAKPLPLVAPHGEAPSTGALQKLIARGVLTEWTLTHPTLPLRGVADLIRRDAQGTTLVDFKTGETRDAYEQQLAFYALLWWRTTGDLPVATSIRHPRGSVNFTVTVAQLTALEGVLRARIDALRDAIAKPPAKAMLGAHCASCGARPFCDDYWADRSSASATKNMVIDVEVRVPDEVEANGFVIGEGRRRLAIVWDDDGHAVHGPFVPGERLRIVGAVMREEGVRLTWSTEVFHRGDVSVVAT